MGKESRDACSGPSGDGRAPQYPRLAPQAESCGAADPRPKVDRALNVLTFSQKRIAGVVKKALHNRPSPMPRTITIWTSTIWCCEASVGKNLVMKRFHARARGNAGGIEKFFSSSPSWLEKSAKRKRRGQACPGQDQGQGEGQDSCEEPADQEGLAKKPARRRKLPNGQKVIHRTAPRHQPYLGSRWYAGKKEYAAAAGRHQRSRVSQRQAEAAGVSRIVIERPHKKCRVTIHSARPGVVIAKRAPTSRELKSDVQKLHHR